LTVIPLQRRNNKNDKIPVDRRNEEEAVDFEFYHFTEYGK